MKSKLFALGAKGLIAALLGVAILLAGATVVKAEPRAKDRALGELYTPSGWSAGSVSRGTGFRRAGGSERVREVQRHLRELGHRPGPIDGLFGPLTDTAVRRFQQERKLEVDGVVGVRTLRQLRYRVGAPLRAGAFSADLPSIRRAYFPAGWSAGSVRAGTGYWSADGSERVRQVQRHLRELDYRPGPIDGLFGPRTERAVRQFQQEEQLAGNGVVGAETLGQLRFMSEAGRPPARPKLALQEPEGSASDLELPAVLELMTLALILAVLAELCGGAIAERRRLRPASGPSTAAFRPHPSGRRRPSSEQRIRPPRPIRRPGETVDTRPHLEDVMTDSQKRSYRALLAVWMATLAAFWIWWLQSDHWVTPAGMVINSVMFFWSMLLPGWFFFFTYRMKRPNPRVPVPRLGTAIIVTKAPSEPWAVLRETLEGMLHQKYPYPYDVWLADEAPSAETLRWCEEHGVKVSSRQGAAGYHRPTWPRRTRCKEGNLAYFYDHWGYDHYDVVAQLDADHVPTPGYLRAMVRPFSDPTVGYVAAPSICDKNAGESWAARGRLYREAPIHGPQQAGYSGEYAPSCIGSHYAVRTTALKEAGGLGPELAEDFSTTLMVASRGWRGVFALDAEAHGDGPATFADYIVQEYQWSRSLTNILLSIRKRYWDGLRFREKVKLGFNQLWYPVMAFHMLVVSLFPVVAILTETPWVSVPLLEYLVRAGVVGLAGLAVIWWLRRQGWLRPVDGKLIAWETFLFAFTRWPWVLWGVLQAFAGWALRKQFTFKVTPKGVTGPRRLPLVTLLPYLALASVCALTAIIAGDPGSAQGYYWFCLANALIYSIVAAAVVVLHVRENRSELTTRLFRFAGVQFAATAAVALAVATALVMRGEDAYRGLTVTEEDGSVTDALAWSAQEAAEMNAPAGSQGVILVAVALVVMAGTLVPLTLRGRRAARSAATEGRSRQPTSAPGERLGAADSSDRLQAPATRTRSLRFQRTGPDGDGERRRERGALRIVRRRIASSSTEAPEQALGIAAELSGEDKESEPEALSFKLIGARVQLACPPDEVPGGDSIWVELELFVESEHGRWEANPIGEGSPFRVNYAAFEWSVRELVVSDWLPALSAALGEVGVRCDVQQLAAIPFAVEPTIELEQEIAARVVSRMRTD